MILGVRTNLAMHRVGCTIASLTVFAVCLAPVRLEAAVDVTPSPSVDEQLFLTYVLNDLYNQLPNEPSDQQTMQGVLSGLRDQGNRYHEYIKAHNLDAKLEMLYADYLSIVDGYSDCVAKIGNINSGADAQAQQDRTQAGFDAGLAVGGAAATARDNGASGGDAAVSALVVGGMQYLFDRWQKGEQLNEQKRQAIESAVNDLQSKASEVLARLGVTEADLAAKYGWGQEVRSADPPAEAAEYQEKLKANDYAGCWQILLKKSKRRPRDAELQAQLFYAYTLDPTSVQSMESCAEGCVGCTSSVPANEIYDPYRARYLYQAADIYTREWNKELEGKSWANSGNPAAARALELWDAVLHYDPGDEGGDCRELRAWALMACGRLDEAARQADDVYALRNNTLRFAMNYARLMNARGDTDKSYESFEHAVKDLGFNHINEAKADPDLAAMRAAKADDFGRLVKVNWTWQINYGIFHDDIVVTNSSAFAVTHVDLKCQIQSGQQSWTPELKADTIKPGEAYTFPNVISVPGDHPDKAEATMTCDQN